MQILATALVINLGIYLAVGVLFAPLFAFRGAKRIDPGADPGTLGFRLLILPGAVLLWPLLLFRWLRGPATPPEERNAHRVAARRGRPQ